jgi:L-fuconolactonase
MLASKGLLTKNAFICQYATIRIDSHHHLWRYDPQEYAWIDDHMKVIRRDFLPEHLEREIRTAGIDGVVTVQAHQSVGETEWLLDLANRHEFMRGVVGWVPLTDPRVSDTLGPLAGNPKLKAVRHVVQGEPDPEFILRDDFNRGIEALPEFGLVYDILIYERQLPQTIRFVDRHPNQVFVLDHIAKPRIGDGAVSPWAENIRELAKRANVYCKLSGMVTEADYHAWTERDLEPYFDTALEAFGPKRLMFGSDWPVCLVAVEYRRWAEIVTSVVERFSADERERVMGGTAVEAYKL